MASPILSIVYYSENIWPGWNCTPQNGYFLASKFAIKVTFSGLVEVANGVYKSLRKTDEEKLSLVIHLLKSCIN